MIATLKRGYLSGLMVLTALATLFIVAIVLFNGGSRRWMEVALMSAVGIGYLLVLSFAAYNAFDHRFWRIPAVAGAAIAALMMIVLPLYACIGATTHYGPASWQWFQFFERSVGTGLTSAGLLCLIPFILAFRLKTPGPLIQIATAVGYFVLYVSFQVLIWNAVDGDFETWFTVVFILCGAGTLSVFVLHRFFGIKVPDPLTSVCGSIHLTCPRCLKDQDMNLGDGRCAFCKLRIKIEVEEPLCPNCFYNLRTLTRPICPECGARLREQEISAEAQADLIKGAQANDVARP